MRSREYADVVRRLAVLRWPNEEGTHPGLRPPLQGGELEGLGFAFCLASW